MRFKQDIANLKDAMAASSPGLMRFHAGRHRPVSFSAFQPEPPLSDACPRISKRSQCIREGIRGGSQQHGFVRAGLASPDLCHGRGHTLLPDLGGRQSFLKQAEQHVE